MWRVDGRLEEHRLLSPVTELETGVNLWLAPRMMCITEHRDSPSRMGVREQPELHSHVPGCSCYWKNCALTLNRPVLKFM
jgi:hypothetical protein